MPAAAYSKLFYQPPPYSYKSLNKNQLSTLPPLLPKEAKKLKPHSNVSEEMYCVALGDCTHMW